MQFATNVFIGLTCTCLAFAAADKKLPIEDSSNEYVEIQASVILDKDQIRQEVGADLGTIIVVRMRVRPLTEKAWKIDRDDFLLLDGNLGQRATPYAPSQIAGNSSLVVSSQGTRGGLGGQGNGPIFGIPGLGRGPQQMPGNGGGVGVISGPDQAKSTVDDGGKSEESPLLKALKEKVLPEKEITEPVSGLLYFQIDGKVKAKDLELYYKTPGGKLGMRFRP